MCTEQEKNENYTTDHTAIYLILQCSAMKMAARPRNHRKSNSTDIFITISLWAFSGLNGKRLSKKVITSWEY